MPTIIEADPLSENSLSRNQSLEKDHPLTKKSKTVVEVGTRKSEQQAQHIDGLDGLDSPGLDE